MIVDCFPFLNELDLLEIRLEELKDVVDFFVLIEASETYSGKLKPFVFDENQRRFVQYKVCHIKQRGYPAHLPTPWHREEHTRNLLLSGLKELDLGSDDVVLFSDLDEIPRADVVKCSAVEIAAKNIACYVFEQAMYYYYMNWRVDPVWHGTRMTRYRCLPSFHELRSMIGEVVPDGGWHFRFMGGPERIREQLAAAVHTELDVPPYNDVEHIRRCLSSATDLFEKQIGLTRELIDDTFPRALREKHDRFSALIKTC